MYRVWYVSVSNNVYWQVPAKNPNPPILVTALAGNDFYGGMPDCIFKISFLRHIPLSRGNCKKNQVHALLFPNSLA